MLLNFVLWNDAINVEEWSVGVSHPAQLPDAPVNCTWRAIVGDAATTTLALLNGALVEIPRPIPIEMARAKRWEEALAYRTARQNGGCQTPLGRVDSDPDSQRKINGAATAAMVSQLQSVPFPAIDWTMADNSVVEHDRAAVIAMGMAVVAYINACQTAGTAIREQIESAADTAALAAIDISAGYPT